MLITFFNIAFYHFEEQNHLINLPNSQFVWANSRADRIGRAIPVCSIGRLPILKCRLFHSIFGRAGRDSETKWRKQLLKRKLKNGLF